MNNMRSIRIVLVETSHPGNIGGAARAMKTMCLERLYLVRPKAFPHADASARAAGADDILAGATLCGSLDEALHDTRMVVGTSARPRSLAWPPLDSRVCAQKIIVESTAGEVALVFGRECSGLTNAELDRCHFVTAIPCNPDYRSLNLAAAVQVMCYELMMCQHGEGTRDVVQVQDSLAAAGDIELFYRHLERTLIELDFLNPANPRHLMRRLRRLFNRARLTDKEVNILRGILTASRTSRAG